MYIKNSSLTLKLGLESSRAAEVDLLSVEYEFEKFGCIIFVFLGCLTSKARVTHNWRNQLSST